MENTTSPIMETKTENCDNQQPNRAVYLIRLYFIYRIISFLLFAGIALLLLSLSDFSNAIFSFFLSILFSIILGMGGIFLTAMFLISFYSYLRRLYCFPIIFSCMLLYEVLSCFKVVGFISNQSQDEFTLTIKAAICVHVLIDIALGLYIFYSKNAKQSFIN
ncbi:hypothetical protein [Bartonella sp. HY038]|uniref:hypothetical protein n=1 Tax=Bartonella sp. HY038 TaxID=2759660 RepID=UPI0015F8E517|nr:hypothetical protein [Bartonella sp. HY038]